MYSTPRSFFLACLSLPLLLLGGCNLSTKTGQAGLVDFNLSACGAVLNGALGCSADQALGQGGRADIVATSKTSGQNLSVRSDNPAILSATQQGTTATYTITAEGPGTANLIAYDTAEVDRVKIQVTPIAQIDFLQISSGGTFIPSAAGDGGAAGGDFDGTFEVTTTTENFALLFAQVDSQGNKLLGRESFTYKLQNGLMLAAGKDPPTALQFELKRPPIGSNYVLEIDAKVGIARYLMKIVVKK